MEYINYYIIPFIYDWIDNRLMNETLLNNKINRFQWPTSRNILPEDRS